jgi:dihydrolipoamide dehydrogenase
MYDVLVIGGGPGGYAAAIRASQLGGKVGLVEAGELGGTCVNKGCIPSKVWLCAASLLQSIRTADQFGIKASVTGLDLQTIVTRKNGVAGDVRMGMGAVLKSNAVELIKGHAVLKSPREVNVEGKIVEGKKIVLATGSSLRVPEIPGLKEAALTTDQLFDVTEFPTSVLILGSGPIEVEMAFLLSIFGSSVHLAMDQTKLLAQEDHGTSQRISQALKERGVKLYPQFALQSVKKAGKGFEAIGSGAKEQVIPVDKILVSGRRPNTADTGLEKAGVALNQDGSIRVNEWLETSSGGIYAIGDATGGWMLSHASSSMAVTAAENAMGKKTKFASHLVPRGIWTKPEVGAVGLSEDQAEQRGIKVQVGSYPYSINGLAMVRGEVAGAVKIVSEAGSGEILGVHIVGTNATELVGEAVLAMQLEATVQELARSIQVHPTFSEAVVDAARAALNWALYLPKR